MILQLLPSKKNNRTISRKYHIIFWVSYFIFNVIRWGSYFDDYWYSFKSNLVEFPLHIILVYLNVYSFIPKFLIPKKYKTYIFFLLLSLAVLYTIRTGLNYFLVSKNIWPETNSYQQAFTFNHIIAVTIGELYVIALATAIKLTIDWVNQKNRIETLRKEHLKSELNFLKSQIQPHFFFNTLNNLYALTLDKSPLAPDVVLKLSNIMQYVIYDINKPKVSLLNEIKYIQNYVNLELLRCHEKAKVNIDLKGDMDAIKIPPLIYLSFIENCFKHGNKNSPDFYTYISIEKATNNFLVLNLENSIDTTNTFSSENLKNGVGNSNTKRRLDLIYKDQYNLEILKKEKTFTVILKLPLTKK